MLKVSRMLLALAVLIVAIPSMAFAGSAAGKGMLEVSRVDQGTIGVTDEANRAGATKVKIAKGEISYIYSLNDAKDDQTVWLPLQMGDGAYDIAVLENVSGNKYRVLATEKLEVKVADAEDVYLNSVQNVNWLDADKAVAKAKALTAGSKTDEQKATAIYQYIVRNIRYDHELASSVQADYVPDIDETLTTGKGICYGYATLFAAMLRSEGIPTKLVMGSADAVKEYHAWNEVYLNGKWVIIDTTVDAGLKKAGTKELLVKKASEYKAAKVY
ncbi:transglutaminase domain-containing protein [Cohnella cholangitidis]|uniref:Transglutaminase domain-containing protein n=1 Tax=Cohnella cholangitidis TaxID=2598458 RepID=A0A7G5C527_9BACL|nr:transglutaminase-like domain-containing protein [Cohnella cholangitidis]QMV44311.1 transglutaminase domain-containing protein [Cohnella cholangitidis]